MDYTSKSIGFQISKALRYLCLYGPFRTIAKIRGQIHMKRKYHKLPPISTRPTSGSANIGLIGCGNFAFSNIAYYLKAHSKRSLRSCVDIDISRAFSLFQSYKLQAYGNDLSLITGDPSVLLVYIASNHATHADYAVQCIRAGKHVHIEKPHVVSRAQLDLLMNAIEENPLSKVFLGFNRPKSSLFVKLSRFLADQRGPLMINWFIAGHEIPDDHWYFDESEGGRVLGNLCHWSDLTLRLVGPHRAFPCTIYPTAPPNPKSDFIVSIVFADNSCATISFSAKGHAFEGVREVLNVHRGNLLASIANFQDLTIDVVQSKYRFRTFYRDHGHKANIMNSYVQSLDPNGCGEDPDYIRLTAMLFLSIKDALDSGSPVLLDP
jgi:predicted dehydrogenase